MMGFLRGRRRRWVRRGVCVVLACYSIFLLGSLWTIGEKTLASHSSLRHWENASRQKKIADAGTSEDSPDLLMPERLDRVIQRQPGRRPSRRKLSKPDAQQVHVIVEDALPGTFVKQASWSELQVGFQDLQHDVVEKQNHSLSRFRVSDPRSLDRLLARSAVGGPNEMPAEERVRVARSQVRSSVTQREGKEDSGFNDFDPKDEGSRERRPPNLGVWVAPDGVVESVREETVTDTDAMPSDPTPPKTRAATDDGNNNALRPTTPHARNSASYTSPRKSRSPRRAVCRKAANFAEISDLVVYSAFYDDRLLVPLVRMLGIGPMSRRQPVTRFWCVFASAPAEPVAVMVRQSVDCQRRKKYCFYMLHCQIPDRIHKTNSSVTDLMIVPSDRKDNPVIFHSEERLRLHVIVNSRAARHDHDVRSASDSTRPPTFSVCVPPLFGKIAALQLVEFVELNRLLGASHFVFYTFRVSREVSRVLGFYEVAGVVTVMPWNIPSPNDAWNKGESLALADCLFRSMFIFDYVVFSHMNEFFVPNLGRSWQGFVENASPKSDRMNLTAAYEIPPVKFYPNETLIGGLSPKATAMKSEISKFLTLRNTLRGKPSNTGVGKLVVKPERMLEVDSQFPALPISKTFVSQKIDSRTASMYHFTPKMCSRLSSEPDSFTQSCDELYEDRTVWRYKDTLLERAKNVLKTLNRAADSRFA